MHLVIGVIVVENKGGIVVVERKERIVSTFGIIQTGLYLYQFEIMP